MDERDWTIEEPSPEARRSVQARAEAIDQVLRKAALSFGIDPERLKQKTTKQEAEEDERSKRL